MKTEHTLRYLLLRHIEALGSSAPEALVREVAGSLSVERERAGLVVRWTSNGERQEKQFAKDAFAFYTRGDTHPEGRSVDDDLGNENEHLAEAFACEALCLAELRSERAAPVPRDPFWRRALVWDVIFAFGVAAGGLGVLIGGVVAAASLGEYLRRGRLIGAAGLLILALLGPPVAAALAALAGGTLQFLDPDSSWRRARVALCASAVAFAALRLASADTEWAVAAAALAAVAALGIAVLRSLYAFHFRALPLSLPFYCVGLAAEGYAGAAALGLVLLLGATLDLYRAPQPAPVAIRTRSSG